MVEDVGNPAASKTVVFMPGALGSLQTDFKLRVRLYSAKIRHFINIVFEFNVNII